MIPSFFIIIVLVYYESWQNTWQEKWYEHCLTQSIDGLSYVYWIFVES